MSNNLNFLMFLAYKYPEKWVPKTARLPFWRWNFLMSYWRKSTKHSPEKTQKVWSRGVVQRIFLCFLLTDFSISSQENNVVIHHTKIKNVIQ